MDAVLGMLRGFPPLRALMKELAAEGQEAAWAGIRTALTPFARSGAVPIGGELMVVAGTRSAAPG